MPPKSKRPRLPDESLLRRLLHTGAVSQVRLANILATLGEHSSSTIRRAVGHANASGFVDCQ